MAPYNIKKYSYMVSLWCDLRQDRSVLSVTALACTLDDMVASMCEQLPVRDRKTSNIYITALQQYSSKKASKYSR